MTIHFCGKYKYIEIEDKTNSIELRTISTWLDTEQFQTVD